MKRHIYADALTRALIIFLLSLFIGGIITALCGCTSKIYVPVECVKWHTDTVTHYISSTDSVTVTERIYEADTRSDSIAPILDSLGRVIGYERWHFREVTKKDEREITRLQSLVDSLRAVKRDSIDRPVPYPVERKLTRWERTKQDIGGIAIGAVIALTLAAVIIWIAKSKSKRKKNNS